jgi:hypothetical protein
MADGAANDAAVGVPDGVEDLGDVRGRQAIPVGGTSAGRDLGHNATRRRATVDPNLPSNTTQLLNGASRALDQTVRAHALWRGRVDAGKPGAQNIIKWIDKTIEELRAVREALREYIEH